MKKPILLAGAAILAAAPAFAPAHADVPAELNIAQNHAGMAATATDIAKVHMHLQHAVNCLVGPTGSGFDATPGNPCAKAGTGAIPETMDSAQKSKLQNAVSTAQAGIASTDLMTAQKDAKDTADMIGTAK